MATADQWRWVDDSGVQRLVRMDELRAAIQAGQLSPRTFVWREGMPSWLPANQVPELTALVPSQDVEQTWGVPPPPAFIVTAQSEFERTTLHSQPPGACNPSAASAGASKPASFPTVIGSPAPAMKASAPVRSAPDPIAKERPSTRPTTVGAPVFTAATLVAAPAVVPSETATKAPEPLGDLSRRTIVGTPVVIAAQGGSQGGGSQGGGSADAQASSHASGASSDLRISTRAEPSLPEPPPRSSPRGEGQFARRERDPFNATLVGLLPFANAALEAIDSKAAVSQEPHSQNKHGTVRMQVPAELSRMQGPPIVVPAPQAPQRAAITRPAPFSEEAASVRVPRAPQAAHVELITPSYGIAVPEAVQNQAHAQKNAEWAQEDAQAESLLEEPQQKASFTGLLANRARKLPMPVVIGVVGLAGLVMVTVVVLVIHAMIQPKKDSSKDDAARGHTASATASAAGAKKALEPVSSAAVPPPSGAAACTLLRSAAKLGPRASKDVPFEVTGVPGTSKVALGFSSDGRIARGVQIDIETLATKPDGLPRTLGKLRRVVPISVSNGVRWSVNTETGSERLHDIRTVSVDPPLVVGVTEGALAVAPRATDEPKPLWNVEGAVEGLRALPIAGEGILLAMRSGGTLWSGLMTPDHKRKGDLVRLSEKGYIGLPVLGTNETDVAVAFAWRAADTENWSLRLAFSPKNTVPSKSQAFATPPDGPGGDAFAPAIAGLTDGRWVLAWTEGATGNRVVRAGTVTSTGALIGKPVTVSIPGANAGQAVLALADRGRALVVYLTAAGHGAFDLWGASLACP